MLYEELCVVSLRQAPGDDDEDGKRAFLSAIISSGKVDGHGTWMNTRTLKNFAADLNTAIQFKDSHHRGQGFGVSTAGEYLADTEQVRGTFKLIRGWPLNNASYPDSDIFIDAIAEGVITRVSVGFSGGTQICNICNAEWYRGQCWHWPGRKYEVVNSKGEPEMVQCLIEVDDAHLVEVSAVSKGSNPDAMIVEKAERCLREGRLPKDVQLELSERYGLRFDEPTRTGGQMELKELEAQVASLTEERDAALAEIDTLKPLAACGEAGRAYMLERATEAFKLSRGETVKSEDVETFQTRAKTLTFKELVAEHTYLRSLVPEPPAIKSGSQTTQPDTSGYRDDKKPQTRGFNPPHWG